MDISFGQSVAWARQLAPIWFPIVYAITLLIISPLHRVFSEWGGVMQYFCGKEILSGQGYRGWTSQFWPPLFSLSIGVVSKLFSGFTAGKIISIASGSVLLFVAHDLGVALTGSQEIGILTQVFLALSPLYFRESLRANNHMLDSFLFIFGLTLFIKSIEAPTLYGVIGAGLVCGLAGLTRYTSYVLLALPLSLFLLFVPAQALSLAVAFWAAFSIISLPWWVYNTRVNGSPVHSWNHLNVAMAVFPGPYGWSQIGLFQCAARLGFNSVSDVFRANPKMYARNVLRNLFQCAVRLVKATGIIAPFVIPGFLDGFLSFQPTDWFIVVGLLILYVGLVSQASAGDHFLLSWTAVMTLIGTAFLQKYIALIVQKYGIPSTYPVQSLVVLLLVVAGLAWTVYKFRQYLNWEKASAGLADLDQVTRALAKHDPKLATKVIMAVDPARAYYAGAKYLSTPLDYNGPLGGLVEYHGLGERAREYAPRYPANMPDERLQADYLIYTRTPENIPCYLWEEMPQFPFLLDSDADGIPASFERIYLSEKVAVYEIHPHPGERGSE
jgi:4-amino-4-deoxy-L-arabinose transferase-like glycosyltransferase